MSEKTGVLGGTFDPPHIGHMRMAKTASRIFDLDKVIFIPAFIPPHKKSRNISSPYHRYAMTVLGILDYDNFTASTFELEKEKVSYTYQTMRVFKKKEPEAEFFFLMGADSLLQIDTWKNPFEILKSTNMVVLNRPRFEIEKKNIPEDLRDRIQKPPLKEGKNIYLVEMDPVDISSTDLRESIREDKEVTEYLPGDLNKYIERIGLYSNYTGNDV